jgi:hypothetical protein
LIEHDVVPETAPPKASFSGSGSGEKLDFGVCTDFRTAWQFKTSNRAPLQRRRIAVMMFISINPS